jgi:thioredoxin reductase (NADPH)
MDDASTPIEDAAVHQVIIVGSGPAGLTAAIYAARARLRPLVVASGVEFGGELMKTTEVENFPGFPEGIMGPDLMARIQQQAERFGAGIVYDDVERLELEGPIKRVHLAEGGTREALTVIFATGSAYRKLGVPGEERLTGYGVSWCATCDGAFFRRREVAVIGGGDSALEEASFLTRFADTVYLVHRRNEWRASKVLQERVLADPKIQPVWNSEVEEICGDENVSSVRLRSTLDSSSSELEVAGVFVAVGADPRTHLVHGQLSLTRQGTIAVERPSSLTVLPGVFAAGDVVDPIYKQAVTAAASGTIAALDAERYLSHLPENLRAGAPQYSPISNLHRKERHDV